MRQLSVLIPGIVMVLVMGCSSQQKSGLDTYLEVIEDAGEEAFVPTDVVSELSLFDGLSELPDEMAQDGSVELIPEVVPVDTIEVDTVELLCGDEVCGGDEDCATCPMDCGECTECGNGVCEAGDPVEDPVSCPADCGPCGDGVCGLKEKVPEHFCAADCAVVCGDGICAETESGEAAEEGYCPPDCGGCGDGCCGYQDLFDPDLADCKDEDCSVDCGDGICSQGEQWQSCPVDCGWCGDDVCGEVWDGPEPCPEDCVVPCGDGLCTGEESAESCPMDCGPCGDGVCGIAEQQGGSCPLDCPPECGNDKCEEFETTESCPADCGCVPLCDPSWECGLDGNGCQESCGECPANSVCLERICCVPDSCKGKQCGSDGCAGSCGTCPVGQGCEDGHCAEPQCVPDCTGKVCGNNGCGGICGVCDDGLYCTENLCNGGSCLAVVAPLYCVIEGNCQTSGATAPGNLCQQCKPAKSKNEWTEVLNGYPCPEGTCYSGACCDSSANCDGKNCGSDGCGGSCGTCPAGWGCQAGECQEGAPCEPVCDGKACGSDGCGGSCGSCDDGLLCTKETCLSGSCMVEIEPLYCLVDGECVPSGAPDPTDPCRKCLPAVSQQETSPIPDGMSCDDDNLCTVGDVCTAGICISGALINCNDSNPCTVDDCVPASGDCTNDNLPDGTSCGPDDQCQTGQCQNANCPPGKCDDGSKCTNDICDPADGSCTHELDHSGCNDGISCTEDTCSIVLDSCEYTPVDASCDDSNDCTSDGCDPGFGCTFEKKNGTSCDGLGTCEEGVCVPPDCNDGNWIDWDGCKDGDWAEFQLNTTTADHQKWARVDGFEDGGFVVSWQSGNQGTAGGTAVLARRFDHLGVALTEEIVVDSLTTTWDNIPDVAVLSGQRWALVWSADTPLQTGGLAGLIYNADNTVFRTRFVVNELTNGAKHYPSVVGDAGGGFSAVWVTRQGSDQETILGRHFDPFGEPIGGDVVLHGPDPGIGKLEASGIASLADGKRVVGWDRIDSTGDNIWHVFGGLYSDFEMPVDSAIVLGGEQLENERWATVAAFGQGAGTGFVAVWRRSNGDSHGFAIIGRRFDLSGTPLGPEFQINETDTGSQDWPAVDGNLDGSFAVSWSGPGADGQQNGVWVRKFSANGSPETGEILANAADIPTAKPRNDVALLADGSMVTVWQNDDQDGDGSGVFAQRFSPDGSVCGRGECSTEPEHCPPDFCDDGVDCTLDVCLPPSGPCAALQITEGGLCAPAIVCNYLGCGGCADGNGVDWDGCTNGQISEFLVNTETNDSQYGATIGTAPDGRYVVAWISENQVVQSDIFAQLYGPDGNPVGGEFRVNDYYFGSQWHPGAAMNSDGKFAIVYRDPLLDGDDRGICARFYTADGTPVDTEIVVNQFVTGWQQHPVGTALADGRFLFAWESSQQDGSNYAVVARLYEPDGTPVDDEFVANTFTINRQDNPAVAALPAGGYVIVWESLMQIPGGAEDVFGTVFDNNSNPVSLEFLVNETSFSSDEMPQVAALDTGGFVVVWQAQIELGNAGIRGRLFAADGTPESSDLLFFDDATNQGAPAVIGLPDGRFAVFWYDGVIGESDARGRLFSADGSPDSDVFAVHATTESIQGNVMVSGFENSDFMAVWNSSDQDGAKTGIFAQRFSKNGIKLSQ